MITVVGVFWLSWLTLKVLKAFIGDFCAFFLAPLGISRINLKKYGSWAGGAMCSYYSNTDHIMNYENCSCHRGFIGNRSRLCSGGKLMTVMIFCNHSYSKLVAIIVLTSVMQGM